MLKIRLKAQESPPAQRKEERSKQEDVAVPRSMVPPHLSREQLPEARGAGIASSVAEIKILGYAVQRRNGDKVHICTRCNFPIAIYGRLHPCEHIFCLTCARKDSICFLCDEKVSRVRKIEALDGVFICGAPRCLKSFLEKQAFEHHVKDQHKDLVPGTNMKHEEKMITDEKKPQSSERQSRQQQFRNAQHQKQMDQLKQKAPKFGYSPSLPDYSTIQQDGQNFYAAYPQLDDQLQARWNQPPGFG
ncbi:E3 ubiquitin-protein ligase CBLL2-like [Selaginella moellendorffii]|uniref:E3 ubiquitin-protein ligase CBLL2-like n=1 Tax=Selaginella moellendorffii TaxID=88036 RepID=UPI000D1C902E|nr:E3 ubiquitin-protein ligase CBLL2-like [Selaginella moellendorffii]|eukprot:XP_024518685.1 E3 ubiquitin-protein ligase CBLL2-like [Selaginella moellendorffii]